MLQSCACADWWWAVTFNRWMANGPPQEDPAAVVADTVWGSFRIRLLSKSPAPTAFKFLRPIAILIASSKLWSQCCFHKRSEFDQPRSPAHLGFCPGHSCIELLTITRLVLERRCEWRLSTSLAQLDFSLAYDSLVFSGLAE